MNWNNYVWLIGGGRLQEPMAKWIKANGYDLLITDANAECYCSGIASTVMVADTYDISKNVNILTGLIKKGRKPKGILTDGADVGITVSTLCEIAELPATPLSIAKVINNKVKLRKALKSKNPVWLDATEMWCSEAYVAWCNLSKYHDVPNMPVVFKPATNCASRGIRKINTLSEFEEYYDKTKQYNKGNTEELLIEQCLYGEEYATDWFVFNGKPKYVNGAKRVFDKKFGIELGHTNPVFPISDSFQVLAEHLCEDTGYEYGPLKIDFIYSTEYGCCILEAATRWSGGYDHGFTAKVSTGRNLEKPLLDFALGNMIEIPELNKTQYSAAIGFYHDMSEFDWDKLETLEERPDFIQIFLNDNSGKLESNADRNVFIITKGCTEELAWKEAEECKKIIIS